MAPVRRVSGALALIKLAQSLYRRWDALAPAERERLRALAERAKSAAFELRGRTDRRAAEAELNAANEALAGAIAESVAADPDATTTEIDALRSDLRRELDRVDRSGGGEPPARAA